MGVCARVALILSVVRPESYLNELIHQAGRVAKSAIQIWFSPYAVTCAAARFRLTHPPIDPKTSNSAMAAIGRFVRSVNLALWEFEGETASSDFTLETPEVDNLNHHRLRH